MRRFRYAQKFRLIAMVAALPFALLLFFFISEVNRGADVAATERAGLSVIRPAFELWRNLNRMQPGISAREMMVSLRKSRQSLEEATAKHRTVLGADIAVDYQNLTTQLDVASTSLEPTRYASAAAPTQSFIQAVALRSQLVLDPETDSYFTQDALLVHLQRLATSVDEVIAKARTGDMGADTRWIAAKSEAIDRDTDDFIKELQLAYRASPSVSYAFARVSLDLRSSIDSLQKELNAARPNKVRVLSRGGDLIAEISAAFNTGTVLLDGMLTERYESFVERRSQVLFLTLGCLCLAVYLHIAFFKDTRRELERLSTGLDDVAADIYSVSFEPGVARDEVAEVTRALSAMVESLQTEDHSRRALEAQVRESQKMEAVGTLAAGIAHDFNNVLYAIHGNVELALAEIGADGRGRESIVEIQKATRRAKDMVQQILTFARHETTRRERVNIPDLVGEIFRLLRSGTPSGVELHTRLSSDTPAILGDSTQLHQVLVNLCTNACQALGGKAGTVTIRTSRVNLSSHLSVGLSTIPPGEYALIEVSDTGPGIPAELRDRVFEPFFTTKPKGSGTGLGLSVVQRIIKEHGGIVVLETFEGEGTTFGIYLPAVDTLRAKAPFPASTPEPESAPHGERVVYLDDDEALVLLVQRALSRQGLKVFAYLNPSDALNAILDAPNSFDIVFSDYNMPTMGGLEFARKVLEIRADMPICITSGYISPEMVEEAKLIGIRELIYKPNSIDALCQAIVRHAKRIPSP